MKATAKNGDVWTGEKDGEWWIYRDSCGNLYESKEIPAFRIAMDNATQTQCPGGRFAITPIE